MPTSESKDSIQLLYCFGIDLATYLSGWRKRGLELPDFSSSCPLCRGRGCAVLLGYYRRHVLAEAGELVTDFPIARYRCRRRGARHHWHRHVTFSILPHVLVPYARISLPYLEKMVRFYGDLGQDVDTFVKRYGGTVLTCLEESFTLLTEAYAKLKATRRSWPELKVPATNARADLLGKFWTQLVDFAYVPDHRTLGGLAALGLDFYHRGGGWQLNAHFLWGTPAQFRLP